MDTVHPMDILSLVTALVYIGTVFYFRSRKSERRNVLKVVIDACREIGILTVVLYNLAAVAIILLIREPQSYVAHGFIASIDITDLNLFLWVILLLDFFGLSLRVKLDFLEYQVLGLYMASAIWVMLMITYTIQFEIIQKWLLFLITAFTASVIAGFVIASFLFLIFAISGWMWGQR